MRYTLVLAIEYKKYKNPADITIWAGDRVIDSFQLVHDLNTSTDNLSYVDDEMYWEVNFAGGPIPEQHKIRRQKLWKEVPSFFKVYEIDDQHLNGKIRIEVRNSNTDYTNGFMKNNSLIRFPVMGLLPSHMTDNKAKKTLEIMCRLDRGYTKYRMRNKITNIFVEGGDNHSYWPTIREHHVIYENNPENNKIIDRTEWIGGSFSMECPVRFKHGVYYLGSVRDVDKGFFWSGGCLYFLTSLTPLLNIYNEDKRSNSTKD